MKNYVITGAVRTPVGAYLGALKTVPPEKLGELILKEVLEKSQISPEDVGHVILGDVLSRVPNIARVSSLLAGYPITTPSYTIDRQCGSSLQAVISALSEIALDDSEIVVAGGVESMSRAPYYLDEKLRYEGMKMGDSLLVDAFAYGVSHVQPPELYPGLNMGLTAENIAKKYHITRQMADQFALESQIKTHKAKLSGKLSQEILPVEIIEKKSRILFEEDEHPRPDTSLEALGKLKPVFLKDGSGIVTAGNSSGMNDGASAVVVMSEDKALQMGIPPLVRIISWATAGVDPALMGLGPVPAIQKALKKASLSLEDMDLIEINEAFATQTLGCLKELGIEMNSPDYHKVNVNGGAIAQGHALGSSGTRILTTLIHELNRRKGRYGVASLCIGGGQGIALIIENFHYK